MYYGNPYMGQGGGFGQPQGYGMDGYGMGGGYPGMGGLGMGLGSQFQGNYGYGGPQGGMGMGLGSQFMGYQQNRMMNPMMMQGGLGSRFQRPQGMQTPGMNSMVGNRRLPQMQTQQMPMAQGFGDPEAGAQFGAMMRGY